MIRIAPFFSFARSARIPCVVPWHELTGEVTRVEGARGFPRCDHAVEASRFLVRPSHWRAALGVLLVVIGVAGCGAGLPPVASTQQECEKSGGAWRSGICERSVGGGY